MTFLSGFTALDAIANADGSALAPGSAFSSEVSLGWYRSAGSTVALSYGTISFPANVATIASAKFMLGTGAGNGNAAFRLGGNPQCLEVILADASDYTFLRARGFYVGTAGINPGLDLNQGRMISMRTLAGSAITASAANTNVAVNEVVFTVTSASGASLCINSGGTTWIFNSVLSVKNT